MILSLYNNQFLLKNEPKFLYSKLKIIFDKLKDKNFIFPEEFDLEKNDCAFYSFFDNTNNFNEVKINNSFFKPELLISKIETDHIKYLNDLNVIYNSFYYNLNHFIMYKSFILNKYLPSESNYFKFVFDNENSNSISYNRSPILNIISYKFIRLIANRYASLSKNQTFSKISKINKNMLSSNINNFVSNDSENLVLNISEYIITKILKINNCSETYSMMIQNLISENLDKIKNLLISFVNNKVSSYSFIDLNHNILEDLTENITYNVLNYPSPIFYFVNSEVVIPPPTNDINNSEQFIIENFKNNILENKDKSYVLYTYLNKKEVKYFDTHREAEEFLIKIEKLGATDTSIKKYIDDIWDPDDDNDYVNLLRKLNPDLDLYYKTYFVVQDNKTLDNGGYLSHIEILENQIFDIIKNNIRSRETETSSIFYIAAQFSETSSLHYLNSLIFSINNYINEIVNSELYERELDEKILTDRIVNLLIKNIYINNNTVYEYFNRINFKKLIINSKAIDNSVFNFGSGLIHDFFDSNEFKNFLLKDFFTSDYLTIIESRFPKVRDDLMNNLNNLINGFKFIFCENIYNKKLFSSLETDYKTIYNDIIIDLKLEDIQDIYDNYLLSSTLQTDEYKKLIKNAMISYTYSLYLNIFLDNFRINKKFSEN